MPLRDDYIDTLEAENDTLRERVRHLEHLLGVGFEAPPQFLLTKTEATIFGVLMARELATKDHIMAVLYRDLGQDEPEVKILDVLVCKLRAKLTRWSINIETSRGFGWYMTAETKAKVRDIIGGDRQA